MVSALEIIILSYLSDRFKCIKINTTINSWTVLLQGVPQGSVLEPILFNDLFFLLNRIDTPEYVCDANLESVKQRCESVECDIDN